MTEKNHRKLRRWIKWLAAVAVVTVLVIGLLPWWFPWVLKPVAGHFGVRYETYERTAYDAFRLRKVAYKNRRENLEVSLQSVEARLFWGWLADRWSQPAIPKEPKISVDGFFVGVSESPEAKSPKRTRLNSTAAVLDRTMKIGSWVRAWVSLAEFRNGLVALPGVCFRVSEVRWTGGILTGRAVETNRMVGMAADLDLTTAPVWRLRGAVPALDLSLAMTGRPRASEWALSGEVQWFTNTLEFQGRFGKADWWPQTASLEVPEYQVPRRWLDVAGLQSLSGSLQATWTNRQYAFLFRAKAERPSETPWVPARADVALQGRGDLESATVETLDVQAAPLQAHLAAPVTCRFRDLWQYPEARMQVLYDLGTPSSVPLRGRLAAELRTRPSHGTVPPVDFVVTGSEVQAGTVPIELLRIQGYLIWPLLRCEQAEVVLPEAAALAASGEVDLGRLLVTNAVCQYRGRIPSGWLPEDLMLDGVDLRLEMEGGWRVLRHRAQFRATNLQTGVLEVESARLAWAGQAGRLREWRAELQTGSSILRTDGSLELGPAWDRLSGQLSRLDLVRGDQGLLGLAQPAGFELRAGATNPTPTFHLDKVTLTSPAAAGALRQLDVQAEVQWPQQGTFDIHAVNLEGRLMEEFLTVAVPPVTMRELHLDGDWQETPLNLGMQLIADYPLAGAEPLQISGTAQLDTNGVRIPLLALSQAQFTMAHLQGHLPLTLHPASPGPRYRFAEDQPLELRVETIRCDPVWQLLEEKAQLRIVNPSLSLVVTGPLQQAAATLDYSAEKMFLPLTNLPVAEPGLENIRMQVVADRHKIEVSQGVFSVLNQPGTFSGRYEIDAASWPDWLEGLKRPDRQRLSGEVQLQDAKLEAVATLVPDLLLPLGRVDLKAGFAPGGKLYGHLQITNAATKSLAPIGSVRNIHVQVEMSDHTVTLTAGQADLGGQPLTASGWIHLQTNALPLYELRVQGDNLSLVRGAGLLIRGDLDLLLENPSNQVPRISGDVALRQSLLFKDLRSLLDINLNQPERRPPYFTIAAKPFADWQLDLRVRGDRFLRVVSQVFRGEVSAGLRLSGTLREPVAIGEVTVPAGWILFPFGTLHLTRGRIYLTLDNPYQPRLDFQGSGYNFGYFVQVGMSGTADGPTMTFHSVPPLTPKEILLMLSAGEAPKRNVSSGMVAKASQLGVYLGKELLGQFMDEDATDRLVIRSGEQVTEDGRLTYSLEYKLSDRWSAIGEYNRFRDVHTGLKYKLYSK